MVSLGDYAGQSFVLTCSCYKLVRNIEVFHEHSHPIVGEILNEEWDIMFVWQDAIGEILPALGSAFGGSS